MGYNQSKQEQNNVAIAQTVTNEAIGQKVNYLEIVLIIISVAVVIVLLCLTRTQCKKRVRTWLRKEAAIATMSPPVVRVQTVQPPTVSHPTEVY